MNIIEIKRIIDSIDLDKIILTSRVSFQESSGTYYETDNIEDLYIILNQLKKIEFLEKDVTEVTNMLFTQKSIHAKVFSLVETKLYDIKTILYGFTKYFDSLSTPEHEKYIKIKLPPLSTFEEFSKILNDLKFAISVPLADCEGDNDFRLTSVEPGSMWLIAYGTLISLTLIGRLTMAALKVRQLNLSNMTANENLKHLKLDNAIKQNIKEKQKEKVDELLNELAIDIDSEFYNSEKNIEKIKRSVYAIQILQKLIDNGTEIHPYLPSNDKSESSNNIFPDFKEYFMLNQELKKIEEKK